MVGSRWPAKGDVEVEGVMEDAVPVSENPGSLGAGIDEEGAIASVE